MALATANLAQLRYIRESTFGTTPVAGVGENIRMTGESLAYAIGTKVSGELRSDRQETDLVQISASGTGGVNFELSYKEFDDFLEDALQSTWLGANDVAGITATITDANTLTASAATPFAGIIAGQTVRFTGWATPANNGIFTVVTASGTELTFGAGLLTNEADVTVGFSSFGRTTLSVTTTSGTTLTAATGDPFANVVVGQMIKISGMTTAANNQVAKVVTKTSSKILVFASATFAANETAGTTRLSSSRLSNGVTQRSYTLERNLTDVTQFFAYRGMTLDKMSLKFASGDIVGGSFDFMGKDAVRAGETVIPGTSNLSDTFDVMNAVAGVGAILEAGAALTGTFIKSLDLNTGNTLRARDGIGTLGAVSIGSGTFVATGSMEVYLADGTLYDKFIANTASALQWNVTDGAGNGYTLQLPNIKFSDAKVNAGGKDQDVMLSMPFTALMDPTTTKTLLIDRFGV